MINCFILKNRLVSTRDLAVALEYQLGLPPTETGMRLKPERTLARHLGVNHMRVHRSLEQLVNKGILVRKHGSGIYVRKVPKTFPLSMAVAADHRKRPIRVPMFAEPVCDTRLRPPSDAVRLHLGMWGAAQISNESGRSILRGIVDQATELGHRMVSYPITTRPSDPIACDGYIVLMPLADAFHRVIGANKPPTVYIWYGNAEPLFEPLVQLDAGEALVRALRLLAAQGFQRIGLIGLEGVDPPPWLFYDETLRKLRLSYRASEFCGTGSAEVTRAVRRLFDRRVVPDALYVADDIVMRSVARALKIIGRVPGKNLGLITFANRGNPLPAAVNWSRLEFDPYSLGRIAVQSLLKNIETAGEQLLSLSHQAAWRPGDTHRTKRSNFKAQFGSDSDRSAIKDGYMRSTRSTTNRQWLAPFSGRCPESQIPLTEYGTGTNLRARAV